MSIGDLIAAIVIRIIVVAVCAAVAAGVYAGVSAGIKNSVSKTISKEIETRLQNNKFTSSQVKIWLSFHPGLLNLKTKKMIKKDPAYAQELTKDFLIWYSDREQKFSRIVKEWKKMSEAEKMKLQEKTPKDIRKKLQLEYKKDFDDEMKQYQEFKASKKK